ncbi:unnamed protein product [Microthlaspi erraticum]|uniref:Uncharacterized protein n=1 Tax=Microthlaspi erraticum TaxID=1685480 RepID=A0A6D2K9R0_9BRAS|nr:unnamed protein product [Microthlaspi erraticum]
MAPTFLRSRSFSPLQGGSLPKSLTEPLLSSQGKGEDNTEKEEDSKARRSSSTTGLDRVQTEETQLGRVGLEEPSLRIRDLSTIQRLTRSSQSRWNPYGQYELAMLHQGQGSHTHFNEEEEEEEPQARSSEGTQSSGVLLMAVYHLQTTTLPPSSLGGTEAKFGGANSSSIELGVKTRKVRGKLPYTPRLIEKFSDVYLTVFGSHKRRREEDISLLYKRRDQESLHSEIVISLFRLRR